MIKAVIFDCFGVLYAERLPGTNHPLVESESAELRDLVHEGEYGLIDGNTLHSGIAELTGRSVEEIKNHLVGEYARNVALLQYAQTLRPKLKVAMLSNLGSDTIQLFFTPEERQKFFDESIVSSEVGMVKPHPEIFEYACKLLGVDVSETIMIDDVEANCAGATEAGLRAVLFQSNEQAIAECLQLINTVE
jgi:HAD superfamily hydrolase (TIGR01509 family)